MIHYTSLRTNTTLSATRFARHPPIQAKDKDPQFKFRLATLILTVDIKFDNKTRVPLTSSLLTSLDLESANSYLSFLEDSILSSSASLSSIVEDGEDSEEKRRLALGKCLAFVEALYRASKLFQKDEKDGKREKITTRVYAFLLAASFFDSSEVSAPVEETTTPGKKKKGKVRKGEREGGRESERERERGRERREAVGPPHK
jgi:hypothetical protein